MKRLGCGSVEIEFCNFVRAEIDDHSIYNYHDALSMSTPKYCNILDRLARDEKVHNSKIIAGDFNVEAVE